MSALDNLKDGSVNIDITNPDHTVGVMESDSEQQPVTMSRAKTIITPENQKVGIAVTDNQKVEINKY